MQSLFRGLMDCIEDGLEASRYMQFPKNAVHMDLDGLFAYEELIANFFVRATRGEVR
jgi:hypothetical protein